MNIQFTIRTLGYMVAEIETEAGFIFAAHSSSYGDKFQELLNGFFLIYKLREDGIFHSFELMWNDDRIDYLWDVKLDSSNVIIKIFEVATSDSNHRWEILSETVELHKLLNDIYFSLDIMLREFGLIGYKAKWEVGNFPIYEYLKLKAERYSIDLKNQEVEQQFEWKEKVSLEDEIKLIQLT